MTLNDVKIALLTVTQNVSRYTAGKDPVFPYIVWADDGESDSLYGDNKMIDQVISGTIDLFTKTVDDPLKSQIQAALNDAGICFSLNSIQREEKDKKFICMHYEWNFEIETAV
ncbi:hypothetical protein [Acetobacterium sp.]|uniref:hypothetical protein n=1 Tax=Acetobacterium sp. TaxID=1872094 RepID=UPI00271CD590|nr:hypothetical protein [Acetobacterium sp.]MDO9492664.1 hypothetical protein [Acetobacterium sp.]